MPGLSLQHQAPMLSGFFGICPPVHGAVKLLHSSGLLHQLDCQRQHPRLLQGTETESSIVKPVRMGVGPLHECSSE